MCTIYNRCSWGSHILNTASAKRYSEDVIFTMLLRTAVLIQLKYFRTSVYSSYIQTSRIGIAKEIFWNRLQAKIDKELILHYRSHIRWNRKRVQNKLWNFTFWLPRRPQPDHLPTMFRKLSLYTVYNNRYNFLPVSQGRLGFPEVL